MSRWNKKIDDLPKDEVSVHIWVVNPDEDMDFTMTKAESDDLLNQFMHNQIVKIKADNTTYYVNVKNIINIDME